MSSAGAEKLIALFSPVVNNAIDRCVREIREETSRELAAARADIAAIREDLGRQLAELRDCVNVIRARQSANASANNAAQFDDVVKRITWIHSAILRLNVPGLDREEDRLPVMPGELAIFKRAPAPDFDESDLEYD